MVSLHNLQPLRLKVCDHMEAHSPNGYQPHTSYTCIDKEKSLTSVKMSKDVWLTCLMHACIVHWNWRACGFSSRWYWELSHSDIMSQFSNMPKKKRKKVEIVHDAKERKSSKKCRLSVLSSHLTHLPSQSSFMVSKKKATLAAVPSKIKSSRRKSHL